MAKPTCYIQQMFNQYGPEWINCLRPEDIQRNAKRVIKDMVKGTISYEQFGNSFLDMKFLENLIISINNELQINMLNYNSCIFYYQHFPETLNLNAHIGHLDRLNVIYNTVLERLNYVKMTGNIGYLADISGLLFNDRNHLN